MIRGNTGSRKRTTDKTTRRFSTHTVTRTAVVGLRTKPSAAAHTCHSLESTDDEILARQIPELIRERGRGSGRDSKRLVMRLSTVKPSAANTCIISVNRIVFV